MPPLISASGIPTRAGGRPNEDGETRYALAVGRALADQSADEAFKALLLVPPSEQDLALVMSPEIGRAHV